MKKIFVSLLSVAAALSVNGELVKNPDPVTLWKEDGKAIQIAPERSNKAWLSGKLEITGLENGGFKVSANDPKNYTTLRYVPLNAEYPYLEYKIRQVEQKKGYMGYSFSYTGLQGNVFGQVRSATPGTFTVKLFENHPFPNRKEGALRLDLYGQAITFDYIKQVKEPLNYVKVESDAFAAKKWPSSWTNIKMLNSKIANRMLIKVLAYFPASQRTASRASLSVSKISSRVGFAINGTVSTAFDTRS